MGKFKNNTLCAAFGWASSLVLIFLNLYNLPETFVGFGILPDNIARGSAYFVIILILILLIWMLVEMYDLCFKIKKLVNV